MNIQFFEVSQAADQAARLGRWMMDQCYKVEDNELANQLSKVGDMLVEFDMPYGTRWNDFTKDEKRFVIKCKEIWEKQR